MPALEAARAEGANVVAISIVPQPGPVTRWARDHGLGATLALAQADGNVLEELGVDEVPSVVFVRGGRIVGVGTGVVPERFLLRHAAPPR